MIRNAVAGDFAAIRQVVRHAFGQDDEANLVEHLRADGDALVELVEASDIALQGHILYSPLAIERGGETLAAAAESLEAPFSGPHFMALELRPDVLKAGGRVRYAPAFGL